MLFEHVINYTLVKIPKDQCKLITAFTQIFHFLTQRKKMQTLTFFRFWDILTKRTENINTQQVEIHNLYTCILNTYIFIRGFNITGLPFPSHILDKPLQ